MAGSRASERLKGVKGPDFEGFGEGAPFYRRKRGENLAPPDRPPGADEEPQKLAN